MAKVLDNALTKGLSGKIGSIVFRTTRSGKTIACKAPRIKRNKKLTQQQREIQSAFKKYAFYAKHVSANPELREFYNQKAKPGQSAYNMAFKDAAQGPRINNIIRMSHVATIDEFGNINTANDATSECLVIDATDNFKVELVSVRVFTEDGNTLLEAGFAEEQNNMDWTYILQPATAKHSKLKIRAVAVDLPGNNGELEVIC